MARRNNRSDGGKGWRKAEFGLYAVAAIAVVVFSGSLLLSVNRISDSRAAIYASRTTGSWLAFGAELEYRRFMETLSRYALADDAVDRDLLANRFDILWSRIPLLVNGTDTERLRRTPLTMALERDMIAALRRVERAVMTLEPGDRKTYREIRAVLEPFGPRLRELLITVEIDLKQDFQQEVVDRTHQQVFLSFIGVLLGGGAVIVLLFSQFRRAARLSEARRRAMAEADAANQAKSNFLARMTHELRTPLNAVIGYSELMQEVATERGYSELLDDLERVRMAGNHLLAMINDTLDLAKIETGRLELHLEPVDVKLLTREVAETIRPLAQRNGNRLDIELADVAPVVTDATKLRQILFNLLSNAAKFTEDGIISLDMRPEAERGNPMIRFRVSDTGPGIPESQRSKIFLPFVQAGNTTRSTVGSGLGLSVARSICMLMGGSIELERNNGGVGATFTVRLPAEPAAAAAGAAEMRKAV